MSDAPVPHGQSDNGLMHSIIQRIATGPELSKDISLEEARAGMQLVLDGRVDPVQAGVFLIALRMKRETDDENRGIVQAIGDATVSATAEVDDVLSLADPYDGFNRSLLVSPFLAPVLAACGVPTVAHGVRAMGPKFGATHHRVLEAAGVPVNLSPADAAARVSDLAIGWSYVDQREFCPKLYQLTALRTLIVKRPAITTCEVVAMPVRGRARTHLVTGYVHKPYPRVYALLARHAGFASALLVRGVEGGVIPSLSQGGKIWRHHGDDAETDLDIRPEALGIEQTHRGVPFPDDVTAYRRKTADQGEQIDAGAMAQAAAEAGLRALQGAPGAAREALAYGGALCLFHLGKSETLAAGAERIRHALDSGEGKARFEAARGD